MTPDGTLVFLSTRDGQNDLFVAPAGAAPRSVYAPRASGRELTLAHGLRDLAVSADGSTAVVGLWNDLARVDLADGTVTRLDVDAHGALERDPALHRCDAGTAYYLHGDRADADARGQGGPA